MLAYAVRRSSDAADAADVVADTFLVAWRRLADIPPGREARLWLYGVARRMLADRRRAERRRERLAERLRRELPVELAAAAPTPGGGAVMAALGMLAEADREVLLLVAWEQLEPAEIATVLGITRTAAEAEYTGCASGCVAARRRWGGRRPRSTGPLRGAAMSHVLMIIAAADPLPPRSQTA